MSTNFSNWEFVTSAEGRQVWKFSPDKHTSEKPAFSFNKRTNPNSSDKVYKAQCSEEFVLLREDSPLDRAVKFYSSLQAESGHWPGDYGGPHFLTPGLIFASYICESPLPEHYREMIKTYILNHQNEDGGWGLHIEDSSTMFGTAMNYVALRLLGIEAANSEAAKARKWILDNGGVTGIPSWGKFYLSVLGVYEWEGNNSLFPEMWLFPTWLPFHPSRYWCHARMVYLPMAYCYAHKITCQLTPIIRDLRKELYSEVYNQIDWHAAREKCCPKDRYHKGSSLLKLLNTATNFYEKIHSAKLRKKASDFILDYIKAEDDHTNSIDIGPVNQVINSICIYHALGKDSDRFKQHYERWFDYLWLAEDGVKMNGYNGSQLWDTAFAAQAIAEAIPNLKSAKAASHSLEKAYRFIDVSQIKEEVRSPDKYFRHMSVGGWPFSTVEHGWPITDCTAEGLKTVLILENNVSQNLIEQGRLKKAVDVILSLQNKDGGWASYELTRAPCWVEMLNPSELFGNIMIDHSYTECSSACLQSLLKFRERFPEYRTGEIDRTIERGLGFIMNQQRPDGSWYGSWAVCFTYGTWFAVEAITAYQKQFSGRHEEEIFLALEAAKKFLYGKQRPDGGWSELVDSCREKRYVEGEKSYIINTAWAVLSLLAMNEKNDKIDKAISLITSRQLTNGDFPQEAISGVFNHSCGITYTSYRNTFPIWAMGRYSTLGIGKL